MKITLDKASGRALCRHYKCKRNSQHVDKQGYIKKGTLCVAIGMQSSGGWHTSYYCRDCIDQIFLDVKTILNPNLWILT